MLRLLMPQQTGDVPGVRWGRIGLPHCAFQVWSHELTHALLLVNQTLSCIHPHEAEFVDDALVLLSDQPLKASERLVRISRQSQVQSGLIELQLRTAERNAAHRF